MSSSSSTTVITESSSSREPTNWFAGSKGQLTKFQILFNNLKQLMAFEEGQKPTINHQTKILTIDTNPSKIWRYWNSAFNPKFVDELCGEIFQSLKTARIPLEKSKKGERLSKREAWTVQKAFQIAQLLLYPVNEDGTKGKMLVDGFASLMKTYAHKKNVSNQLNIYCMKWDASLREESLAVLKNREYIEQIHEIWDRLLAGGAPQKTALSPSPSKLRHSKVKQSSLKPAVSSPSASTSSSHTPPLKKIIQLFQEKPLQTEGLDEPSSSNVVFDKTVKRMTEEPHKKTIKEASPSFLQLLRSKIAEMAPKRAQVLERVEQYHIQRIMEVNLNSANQAKNFVNTLMLQRARSKADPIADEIEDFFHVEDYSEIVKSRPMEITRSISASALPVTDFRISMKRQASVVFDACVKEALEKKFQNCFGSSDDTEDWSEE